MYISVYRCSKEQQEYEILMQPLQYTKTRTHMYLYYRLRQDKNEQLSLPGNYLNLSLNFTIAF